MRNDDKYALHIASGYLLLSHLKRPVPAKLN